jgi:hypothetical protein
MQLFGLPYHHLENPLDMASPVEIEFYHMLAHIITNQEKIMSDLTDLQSAVADLATDLTANNAEIATLLTKITTPGVSSADIQTNVAAIRALIATNAQSVKDAQTAAP